MEILKPKENTAYDNLYAKPASIDDYTPYSVVVLFSVHDVLYYGQYNSEKRTWSTLPSDEKMRIFKDSVVQFWFYEPRYQEIFKTEPHVNQHSICRSREYVPNSEVYEKDEIEYMVGKSEKTSKEIETKDNLPDVQGCIKDEYTLVEKEIAFNSWYSCLIATGSIPRDETLYSVARQKFFDKYNIRAYDLRKINNTSDEDFKEINEGYLKIYKNEQ